MPQVITFWMTSTWKTGGIITPFMSPNRCLKPQIVLNPAERVSSADQFVYILTSSLDFETTVRSKMHFATNVGTIDSSSARSTLQWDIVTDQEFLLTAAAQHHNGVSDCMLLVWEMTKMQNLKYCFYRMGVTHKIKTW